MDQARAPRGMTGWPQRTLSAGLLEGHGRRSAGSATVRHRKPLPADLGPLDVPRIPVSGGLQPIRTHVSPVLPRLVIWAAGRPERGIHARDPHIFHAGDAAGVDPQHLDVDDQEAEVELARLIVDPGARRQGLGRHLAAGLARLARLGIRECSCGSIPATPPPSAVIPPATSRSGRIRRLPGTSASRSATSGSAWPRNACPLYRPLARGGGQSRHSSGMAVRADHRFWASPGLFTDIPASAHRALERHKAESAVAERSPGAGCPPPDRPWPKPPALYRA
jgi:GNAT superfamily N-acetyltransferase